MKTVPEDETTFTFTRSSGPGGQNVNKVSTKVVLRWNAGQSRAFTLQQKIRITEYAKSGGYLFSGERIIIEDQSTRSQHQNRESALKRLQHLVSKALEPQKKRIATKVPRAAKRKRLEAKAHKSTLKKLRNTPSS